ncbi:unnamed protein product [Miscanthus lutarioriparius]|uniref:Uncharacterized protein n=1 Tax=Miscanthus lutarioriparius TaxID=422564 RepID=A0A811NAR1_9POAL|nr:unnamed protein product [Miscanthus lutarioriparius]
MASSSTLKDIPSLIERAIAKLPPDLAAQAVDKKRKARSQDPGWKEVVPAGICRFKQHLAGGYGDAIKCPNPPAIVRKEMAVYLKKSSRTVLVEVPTEDEDEQDAAGAEEPAAVPVPSSGTNVKQAKKIASGYHK